MSFEKLPSEIFVQVLECLPSSFFREDLHRLHIAKRWYECAYPVLFRDVEFSAASLHQFIKAVRTYPRVAAQLRHVRTMTTKLHGFDDWTSPRLLPEFSAVNLDVVNDWTSALNGDLGLLARLLPRLARLETVRFTAAPERYDERVGVCYRSYLDSAPTMRAVCTSNLTSLDFDAGGCYLSPLGWSSSSSRGATASPFHHCEVYRRVPRALRRLRVRAMVICPAILQVLGPDEGFPPMALEDVIVNLDLDIKVRHAPHFLHPSDCRDSNRGFWELRRDMEMQAVKLARALRRPRIVRIISRASRGRPQEAFDAITGRRLSLAPSMPWDADENYVEKRKSENRGLTAEVDEWVDENTVNVETYKLT